LIKNLLISSGANSENKTHFYLAIKLQFQRQGSVPGVTDRTANFKRHINSLLITYFSSGLLCWLQPAQWRPSAGNLL